MPSLSMVFDLLAVDRASAVFDRVGGSAAAAGREVDAASGSVASAGSKMAAGLGLVAAAATVVSVKMAADFQSATTRLVTSAGESEQNLGKVQRGLLDLMGQVGYSSDELTKAMYKVESGGQHGADGLAVLKAAAQGAKTENADLTTVADAVTSAMTDYHLKASDAADVTSKLVAATASGKMTFEELAHSLAAILPIASANHISLNDILGDLASMTVHGMSAEQATQNLADTVRHLAAPTQQSTKELAALGISATDVAANLGQKGLSGTLNEITDAIQRKMGPGSTQIVLDLDDALNKLPASVKGFASGLLDGTKTVGDLRAEIKKLPPDQAAALTSFDSLITSTHQVGAETKSAGQVYQSYSGALRLALGDATSMNTALMITGENSKTTAGAIAAVSGATADAQHNVRGWSDIQGTFNQQLSESAGHVQAMAIEFGMHLLPALTTGLGFINSTVLPGIEHLGSAVGDAAHWFSELPAPVKDFAYALAALRVADMIGVFDRLSASVQRFRDTMALQSALGQMEAASNGAEAGVSRLGSTLSRLASGGFAAVKSGISSIVDAFGGPWAVGLAAAGAAVYGLVQMFQKENEEVKQGTQAVTDYYKAIAAGGQSALPALEALQSKQAELAKAQRDLANAPVNTEADVTAYNILKDHVKDLTSEVNNGKQKWDDYYNSLGLVDQKSADVNVAEAKLGEVMKTHAAGSLAVREAVNEVNVALADQKQAQDTLNQVTKTAAQLAYENANAVLAEAHAGEGSKQAFDEFATSLTQYRATTAHSTSETNALTNAALSTADAAGRAGESWAKAAGMSDTSTASQYGQLLALEKVANAMGVDTPASVRTSIAALQQSVAQGKLTQQQMDAIAHAVDGIPDNQNIKVTADTSQAEADINGMISQYRHITYTGSAILVNGRVVANAEGNLLEAYANGGMSPMSSSVAQVVKPGTLRVIGDNPVADEAFIPINNSSRSMKILGETASRMGMGLVAMADGGMATWGQPWGMGERFPVGADKGLLSSFGSALDSAAQHVGQSMAQVAAQAVAASAGGAARWAPLVDQVLAMLGISRSAEAGVLSLINSESGGNPNAINLWDSNARAGHPSQGLTQTIPSTFARWRNPALPNNILDPLANIYAGVNYALHTYGVGMLTGGGRHGAGGSYVGYETGTNYVPHDGPAYLHKGEAVVPAAINAKGGTRSAPLIGEAHFHNEVDAELLLRRVEFQQRGSVFG